MQYYCQQIYIILHCMNNTSPANHNNHRKLILQQLLQKSQIFTAYFHHINSSEAHVLDMPYAFGNKKNINQPYGTCQIIIPEKIIQQPKKFNRKIMIISKSKGQKDKLNQKQAELEQHIKSLHDKANKLRIDSARQRRQNSSQSKQNNGNIQNQVLNQHRMSNQKQKQMQKQKQKQTSFNLNYNKNNNSNSISISRSRSRCRCSSGNNQTTLSMVSQKFNAKPSKNFSSRIQSANSKKVSNPQKYNELQTQQQTQKQQQMGYHNKQLPLQQCQKNYNPKSNQKRLCICNCNCSCSKQNQQLQQIANNDYQPILCNQTYGNVPSPSARPASSSSCSFRKQYQSLLSKNYQKKLEEQKKNKITFRKQLTKEYTKTFVPPPKISARSYVIYQMKGEAQTSPSRSRFLATYNAKNTQQVASLTKIMTCITVLEVSDRFALNLEEQFVQIGKFQSNVTGTSAQIKSGQIYKISQILYGLMLPSGNDASLALGVWAGRQLVKFDKKNQQSCKNSQTQTRSTSQSSSPVKIYKKDYVNRFIQEMNSNADKIGMSKTKYANTHGLVNSQSKSTAVDIAILCQYCMQNQTFRKIVSTKCISFNILFKANSQLSSSDLAQIDSGQHCKKQSKLQTKQVKWQNTHKLLHSKLNEYTGIKTGVTTSAGPCLASCLYHKPSGRKFIIVVLDCRKLYLRFKQTEILKKWIYKQQNLVVSVRRKTKSMSVKQLSEESCTQWDQNSDQENEKNTESYD